METRQAPPSRAAKRNIQAVAKWLEKSDEQRSWTERVTTGIVSVLGSPASLGVHIIVYGAWLLWNGAGPSSRPFDPPPFHLLTLIVSLEAILLTLFVLVSQNRIRAQADHHAHVDLQVNLMAEQEATKMLGMLRSLCSRFGLEDANDDEVEELMQSTDPEVLFDDVGEKMPKAS